MDIQGPYSVNFGEIQDFLDSVFFKDQKAKEIIEKSGFTKEQIKIINTLIVSALKAYDLQNHQ